MTIKTGQELHLKNLLSIRKRMTQMEIPIELQKVKIFLEKNDVNVKDILSTTFSAQPDESGIMKMDTEILVVLDKEIENIEPFSLKEEIHIVNALCLEHEGASSDIPSLYNEINTYLLQHALQAITTAYTLSVDAFTSTPEKVKVKIFVGLNPNII